MSEMSKNISWVLDGKESLEAHSKTPGSRRDDFWDNSEVGRKSGNGLVRYMIFDIIKLK